MTEVRSLSIPDPITALMQNYFLTVERLYLIYTMLPDKDIKDNPLHECAEEYYSALKYLTEGMYKDYPEKILTVEEFLLEIAERTD